MADVATVPPAAADHRIATGAEASWIEECQRSIAEGEYVASRTERGLQAPNRAHNLRAWFEPRGVRIVDRTASGSPELLRLETMAIGRSGRLVRLAGGTVSAYGRRVENRRRGGLVEWYENSEAGLEHGYDLERRPAGAGPLCIDARFAGARVAVEEGRVLLRTRTGRELEYSKLEVVDSRGRRVDARIVKAASDAVRLRIDDAAARYPLRIDPLLTSTADATLQSNQILALLGYSVAGAGDVNGDGYADVIVGAPIYDSGQMDEGAAFVFHGGAAGVASGDPTTASATLQSNQISARLGISVAGAGDVNGDGYADVIVGADSYDSGQMDEGAAFVFHGGAAGVASGDPATASATLQSNQGLRARHGARHRRGEGRQHPARPQGP